MSDEAAPSNGASEPVVASVDTPAQVSAPETVSEKPAASPREALERAFKTVDQPATTTAKPPHPKDENRHADGTFKGKEADPAAGKIKTGSNDPAKPTELKIDTDAKPVIAAPAGLTKAAQEQWAQTPEAVRADVERRFTELTQGIEKYRAEVQAFEPVRKYQDMAQKSGTTLDKALEAYTGIEAVINQDPIRGLIEICRNVGIDPRAAGAALANMQQLPPQQQPPRESAEVAALKQELAALKEQVGGVTSTLSKTQAQSMIDKFASDHPHFDELSDSISHMLETRFAKDLQDAYDKAIRLNPEVAAKIEAAKAAQAAPQPDPAQTREKASKSITGSPSTGSTPATRKPAGSPREALQNAFASMGI